MKRWAACVLLVACSRTSVFLDEPAANVAGGPTLSDAGDGPTGAAGARAGTGGSAGAHANDAAGGSSGAAGNAIAAGSGGDTNAGSAGTGGAGLRACDVPLAPVISVIDDAETLHFTVDDGAAIETALLPAADPPASAVYLASADVPLAGQHGPTRVLARVTDPTCVASTVFNAVYDVRPTCAPPEQTPDTSAIAAADPLIVGWATGAQDVTIGGGSKMFTDPAQALGPAQGTSFDVVSLGDAGSITLSFASPITNAASWDLAVFENAFNDKFLELAFVEVSSDGHTFLRFDSAFRGLGPKASGYAGDARAICGLAGSYKAGFGTPFDLEALRNQPWARTGSVDLSAIRFVRIVDIVGDGNTLDSFGRSIFDPYPSAPNAGFDLDAIAVLHQR